MDDESIYNIVSDQAVLLLESDADPLTIASAHLMIASELLNQYGNDEQLEQIISKIRTEFHLTRPFSENN